MQVRIPLKLFFLVTTLLSATSTLSAEDKPDVKLKETVESVIELLYQPDDTVSLVEKREQVLAVLDRSFSFDIIVRRTLGRNWNRLNAEQQQKIVSLATDLLIYSYTREFREGERPTVEFEKPVEIAKNKLEIVSVLRLPDNHINLAYRLAHLKSGWEVYDILVEGVSLVSNYRKQFDAHFQKKNGDQLIEQLEEKVAGL